MRANTGGQIAPGDVIGRDALIKRLWRALERENIVLTAARRMGKTSILKKMEADPPVSVLPFYHDLEGLRTPIEFVQTVYSDVEHFLSTKRKTAKRAHDFIAQFSGAEVNKFKFPNVMAPQWKTLLEQVIEDLAEQREGTVVFFWDEMPMMLENIRQDAGEKAAMEVLDALRALRQTYPIVRMVFTGSVGLHHIVSSLKRSGYTNSPINDMKSVDVPPLAAPDANLLALRLLEGEGIVTTDMQAVAVAIAEAADNVAFYIHHIVDRLIDWQGTVEANAARTVVNQLLTDAQNPWDMRHYRQRIDTYYLPEEKPFALNLLDVFAVASQSLTQEDAFSRLASRVEYTDVESVRDVLKMLARDHYLTQDMDEKYSFYLPLIARWWRMDRGLKA